MPLGHRLPIWDPALEVSMIEGKAEPGELKPQFPGSSLTSISYEADCRQLHRQSISLATK